MVPPILHNYFNLCVAFIVLDTVAIIVRFWSRTVASGITFGYDDWTALAAWPFAITNLGMLLGLIRYGLGRPLETVSSSDITGFLKLLYIGEIVFDVAITLPKVSAMLFYLRIFGLRPQNGKYYRVSWFVLMGFIIAWWLCFMILDIAQCIPVAHYWDPNVPGHCTEGTLASTLPATISSAIIDIAVLLLPVPVLWKLHLSRKRKAAALFVIFLGYGVVIGSLGRLIASVIFVPELEADETLNAYKSFYWSAFEPGFSLIAINLPSVFQLIKRGYNFGLSSLFSSRDFSQIQLRDFDDRNAAAASTRRLQRRSSTEDSGVNVAVASRKASVGEVPPVPPADQLSLAEGGNVPLDPVYVRKDVSVTAS